MAYRISFIKAGGWTRLGLAGGVAAAFTTPMLWALGSFGAGDEAIHRAIVHGLSALWMFIAAGYLTGWALQGFVIRQKAAEEDSEDSPPRSAPPPPPRPAPPPKSGGH
jgi:hypothetical protein